MPSLADTVSSFMAIDRIPVHFTSFIPGKTPFSTWPSVIGMATTYLLVVFGTREIMKDRPPLKLTTLSRAHNLLLSVGCLVLLMLICKEAFSNWLKPEIGTYGILCSTAAITPTMEFYLTLNYYLKYYEFLDTVFLALKKRLTFLHVYHHTSAVFLVFVQMNGRVTASWVSISLNLGIHVLMYYYYYAAAGGIKVWWKQHLTTMQIYQFLLMISVAIYAWYHFIAYNWFPQYLPHREGCAGTPFAGFVALGVVISYLMLFVNFFYETYMRKSGSHGLMTQLRMVLTRLIQNDTKRH